MKFQTSVSFSENIEKLSVEKQLPLIETVTWYCEKNGIEVESVVMLITPELRSKIRVEAVNLSLVRDEGGGTLPI